MCVGGARHVDQLDAPRRGLAAATVARLTCPAFFALFPYRIASCRIALDSPAFQSGRHLWGGDHDHFIAPAAAAQ